MPTIRLTKKDRAVLGGLAAGEMSVKTKIEDVLALVPFGLVSYQHNKEGVRIAITEKGLDALGQGDDGEDADEAADDAEVPMVGSKAARR